MTSSAGEVGEESEQKTLQDEGENEVVRDKSNPWGRTTFNWAEDVENAERSGELRVIKPSTASDEDNIKHQEEEDDDNDDFPSLEKAKSAVGKKGKKKGKAQKVSLQAFQAQGLSPEMLNPQLIRMSLPSHSRERAPGEEYRRRPFGDEGYDGGHGRRGRGGYERDDFQRERREPRRDDFQPSEADTVDSWGANSKFVHSRDREPRSKGFSDYREPARPPPRRNGGGFGDSSRASDFPTSQADTKDNWQSERPRDYYPSDRESSGYRGSTGTSFGGYSDRGRQPPPRRTSGFVQDSRADMEDKWSMGSKFQQGPFGSFRSDHGGAAGSRRYSDTRVGYSDTDKWSRRYADDNPTYTPQSRQTSSGAYVPPSQRKDPFGGARPREDVLDEKKQYQHNESENGVMHHTDAPYSETVSEEQVGQ